MNTRELLLATNGKLLSGNLNSSHKEVSINSRNIHPGNVFIAIKGKRFDGHNFVNEAIKNGATCLILSKVPNKLTTKLANRLTIVKVKDTLQDIAAYHRNKFRIPIIGVTGSSGKTTTKDMLASILSQEYKTLKNEENLNNEIGVPLTLLKLKATHQVAVIEMAMQNIGELELLAKIVKPSIAIITNIGEAHLKYLKTRKNIAKAKAEILTYLKSGDYAILPADDKYIGYLANKVPEGVHKILFGIEKIIPNKKFIEHISLPGRHNIYNSLAAIKAAKILKLKDTSIIKGLKKFKPSSKRMEFLKLRNGSVIINDSYNANPSSMKAALLTLAGFPGSRKIAVLGDMLELGKYSKKYHIEIGTFCKKLGINILITVGKKSKAMNGDFHFNDSRSAAKKIKTIIKPRDIILVKGSRGIKMEAAVVELVYTYV